VRKGKNKFMNCVSTILEGSREEKSCIVDLHCVDFRGVVEYSDRTRGYTS
jgi:hypothetical protein